MALLENFFQTPGLHNEHSQYPWLRNTIPNINEMLFKIMACILGKISSGNVGCALCHASRIKVHCKYTVRFGILWTKLFSTLTTLDFLFCLWGLRGLDLDSEFLQVLIFLLLYGVIFNVYPAHFPQTGSGRLATKTQHFKNTLKH